MMAPSIIKTIIAILFEQNNRKFVHLPLDVKANSPHRHIPFDSSLQLHTFAQHNTFLWIIFEISWT